MATPNDGSLPELPCELGNELRLWAGARTRFRGNIVTREKDNVPDNRFAPLL